jgi:hypothetical protein
VFGTGATIQSATATNTLSTLTSIQLSRPQLTVVSRAANNWNGGIHVYTGGQTSGTFLSSDLAGMGRWSAGAVWSGSGNYNATETTGSALRQDGGALVYSAATGLTVGATTTLTELFRIALTGVATFYGNVLAGADATYDLGLSGSGRFRDAYLSRNVIAGTGVTAGTYLRVNGTNAGYIALGTADDVTLYRDAANTLALRNGVNAQAFRVYNTYTDTSNYERGAVQWALNELNIVTEAAGTGATRAISFSTGGTRRWFVTTGGHWFAAADNTYTIGASANNRPSFIYAGTSIEIGGSAPSGSASLTSFGRNWSLLGSSSLADATTKVLRIGLPHYTNAEEPLQIISGAVTSSGAEVYIGGSSSLGNAATAVYIYTAADNTTTTGTARWYWDGSGNYRTIADATYDIGRSGTGRPNNIYAAGAFVAPDGSAAAPGFTFSGTTATGMYRDAGGGRIRFAINGTYGFNIAGGAIGVVSDSAQIQLGASSDVILAREAANTLALRNGANAQLLRVYNTYTDASNYERGAVQWALNELNIVTEAAGTGATRAISFSTGGTRRWLVTVGGSLFAVADATYNIGATSNNRPNLIYVADSVFVGGSFRGASGSRLSSATDGIWRMTNAASDNFDRLQFGLTGATAPALKKVGAGLAVVLANDSGFTSIQGKLTTEANAVAETPTATHTLTLYDAAGTAYKVLAVAA